MDTNKERRCIRIANSKPAMAFTICASTFAIAIALSFLQGCAPKEASSQEASAQPEAKTASVTLSEWTPETDCSACHASEDSSNQDAACTASKHVDLQCADCHVDSETLAKQHEGTSSDDRMPSRLKQTTVESSICLSCHDQDEIAADSADCAALTDGQGTTINPHDLPAEGTHDQIVCTDCHTMHEEQPNVQSDAKTYCLTCHHADVFECYTCHEHS